MNNTTSDKLPDTFTKILGYKTLSTVMSTTALSRVEDSIRSQYRTNFNRVFQLHANGYLKSPTFEQEWKTANLSMECRCTEHVWITPRHFAIYRYFDFPKHSTPDSDNRCGIYSYHNYEQARALSNFLNEPVVSLSNYGVMQVHHDGMRAEKANITGILLNNVLHKELPQVYDVPYFWHTPQGVEDFIANAEKHAQHCPKEFIPQKSVDDYEAVFSTFQIKIKDLMNGLIEDTKDDEEKPSL